MLQDIKLGRVDPKLLLTASRSSLGPCDGVEEHFFAMGTDKKVLHPLVQRLLPGKR